MSRNVQWTHRGPQRPHHLAAFVGGLGDQPRALWVAGFVLQPFAKFTCNDGEREKEKKRKRKKHNTYSNVSSCLQTPPTNKETHRDNSYVAVHVWSCVFVWIARVVQHHRPKRVFDSRTPPKKNQQQENGRKTEHRQQHVNHNQHNHNQHTRRPQPSTTYHSQGTATDGVRLLRVRGVLGGGGGGTGWDAVVFFGGGGWDGEGGGSSGSGSGTGSGGTGGGTGEGGWSTLLHGIRQADQPAAVRALLPHDGGNERHV